MAGRRRRGGALRRWCVAIACLLAWGGTAVPGLAAVAPSVLVVLSYHVGMEWEDDVVAGLKESLGDRADLVLLQLDVKRFPQPGREAAMVANFASKAAMSRPAVVVTVDDFAHEFVQQHRTLLPPGTPVVFGGVNFLATDPPPRTGGVMESVDFEGTLALARSLFPDSRRLVIVNDATETGRAIDAALSGVLDAVGEGLEIMRLGRGTYAETEATLAGLDPERDLVLLLSWNLDAAGVARTYDEAVAAARAASPAPLFGVWGFYFGHGIVGGSLLDGRVHGREVGELAAVALAEGPDCHLPLVARGRTELQVDERELRRFGIRRSRVPAGARVSYETVSFWREVVLGATVIALQAGTIAWLCWLRRRERRAVCRLRASEADLRQTWDSIGDGVVVVDSAARILRTNPVAERLAGERSAALVGRPFAEVFRLRDPAPESAPVDPLARALASGPGSAAAVAPQRVVLTGAADGPRILDITAAPLREADGAPRGAVLALRDVTAQQRTEAQLRQAQKMEAVGRLVGGVAHDFNNLLLVIRGSVELARQPGTDAADTATYLGEIDAAAQRAAELTRQLLAFGRQQKLSIRATDLAVLLAGLLKLVRRVLPATITVEACGASEGCWAKVDPGQIEQVIMNLCLNARDAMPEGGRIVLELERVEVGEAEAALYPGGRTGGFWVVSVGDTGVGMSPETQRRIFEPFFSTKPVGRGTGLGLSVVQGIVQQHEGWIAVRSDPGRGTTFRIFLPAAEAPAPQVGPTAPALAAPAPTTGAGRTVLLAEDDPAVRRIAGGVLRRHGFEVLETTDGAEACDTAARHQGAIDIAVLDVVMPRMSGPEAARRLQSRRPGLPILLCSGYSGRMSKDVAVAEDWQWLAKPYQVAELIGRVERMLAERRARPEAAR